MRGVSPVGVQVRTFFTPIYHHCLLVSCTPYDVNRKKTVQKQLNQIKLQFSRLLHLATISDRLQR